MTLRFGSVCSGIEAASVAWHPLGWQAAWLSEIEPFPSAVLAHHYPDVPNLGDMTTLPERILSGEVEAPDLFCGGTPCQAFSVAGLRKSLDDARGNLSLTFCEIANAIDTVRAERGQQPAIIFWENVPGVLNTKDNAFGCFLAGLAGEDNPLEPPRGKWANAGYVLGPKRAIAWRLLDAQYFGLAQRRRRVFVIASARDDFDPAAVLFEFDGVRRDAAPSREAGQTATHATAPCLTSSGRGVERTGDTRGQDPVVAVPQPYAVANCMTARMHKGINSTLDEGQTPVVTHSLRGEGFDASEDGTGRGAPLVPVAALAIAFQDRFRGDDGRGYGRVPPVSEDQIGTLETVKRWNVIAPIAFSSKDHGADAADDLSPTLRARTPGNIDNSSTTVVAQPIAFSSKDYGGDAATDLSPTLRAMPHDGSHANGGENVLVQQVAGALACNTGPNGHDACNFACNQAVDAGHVLAHAIPIDTMNMTPGHSSGGLGFGQPGDPSFTLTKGHSHAVAVALRGRKGGATAELGDEVQNRLRASQGGGDKPHVLAPVVGWDNDLNASAEQMGTLLKGGDGGRHEGVMLPTMQVRRLTPVECERLQGFPDNYTQIPWRNKTAEDCPDGPRYKALGNSWAVPVVRWIGARIHNAITQAD